MVDIPGLYFVIAGNNRVRFVRPDPENCPHTIETEDITTLAACEGDPPPGATFGTGPPASPGREQPSFVRLLAARIGQQFAVDLFSHLVLVAPAHLLRGLTTMLDAPTQASLYGSLAKDLISVPDLELWTHLRPWLQPGRVASPVVVTSGKH